MIRVVAVENPLPENGTVGHMIVGRLRDLGVADVQLSDGGLAGFDLVNLLDDCDLAVFVDGVQGSAGAGEVVTLHPRSGPNARFLRRDHGSSLSLLLAAIPVLDPPPRAKVVVVGVDLPASDRGIDQAARGVLGVIGEVESRRLRPGGASGCDQE